MSSSGSISLRHYAAYILLCSIWGSTWMAIAFVVREVPPLRAAGLRFVAGALVLCGWWIAKRLQFPATSREWFYVIVLSISMMALPYGLIFWAEQWVSSSMTAVMYASTPLLIALLTPLMTHHTVPRGAILALLVGVGGIAYLFQIDLRGTRETLIGGVMILISILGSSVSSVLAKRELGNVSAVVSTTLQLAIGSIPLLVASYITESMPISQWSGRAILAILFLGVFGSAIAFALYYWILNHIPAYKASSVNLVVPFIAIIEGGLILHEHITWQMFLAAVVVLGAVAFALRAEAEESFRLNLASRSD